MFGKYLVRRVQNYARNKEVSMDEFGTYIDPMDIPHLIISVFTHSFFIFQSICADSRDIELHSFIVDLSRLLGTHFSLSQIRVDLIFIFQTEMETIHIYVHSLQSNHSLFPSSRKLHLYFVH